MIVCQKPLRYWLDSNTYGKEDISFIELVHELMEDKTRCVADTSLPQL
jgi:hypothetical protein